MFPIQENTKFLAEKGWVHPNWVLPRRTSSTGLCLERFKDVLKNSTSILNVLSPKAALIKPAFSASLYQEPRKASNKFLNLIILLIDSSPKILRCQEIGEKIAKDLSSFIALCCAKLTSQFSI